MSILDSGYCERLRQDARAFRARVRAGQHRGHTGGQAPGIVQGNLCILPEAWAGEFLRFCQANPKPCPLLAVSDPGDPMLPALGKDIDIRTDVPRYRIFENGTAVEEVEDIRQHWRSDLVTFVLGCSFSFEEALVAADVPVRHIERGTDIAMFRSNIETTPAGRFSGRVVVNMRPLKPVDAIRAIQITSRFPGVHGAPLHLGDPSAIGIADLDKPDFGDQVPVYDGEIPVFWACGVTPQSIVERSKPPFCITHKASHMLVTDKLNSELAVI